MKALILAAGLGTRLLPHTKKIPKPLFTIDKIPSIKIIIDRLILAGCTDIIINTHHLNEKIEAFIKTVKFSANVETRHEPVALDTGGAIKNVKDFMGNSPFFVINSDIVSDIDFKKIWEFHLKGNWPVTLVMHDYHQFNKVEVNRENFITGFCNSHETDHLLDSHPDKHSLCDKLLAFTGIQVLSPEIFEYMPATDKFSSIEIYQLLATRSEGSQVKAYICDAPYWCDIGTIEAYRKTSILHIAAKCLNTGYKDYKKIKITEIKGDGSDRKWFRVEMQDSSSLSRSSLHNLAASASTNKPDMKLNNKPDIKLKSLIIADHGIYPENFEAETGINKNRILPRYNISRLFNDKNIDIDDDDIDTEIESFIAIGSHLFSKKIPVPKIYRYDLFSGMAALEDLGDTHLQKIINELQLRNDTVQIIKWYEKTCDLLINFSIKGMENFNPSWSFQTEAYTKELIIEKECRYFLDAFICGYLQLEIKFKALKETFDFIAENAVKYSFSGLMHRDMQSRNIMVKNKQIFFIDFQAARKGPLQYDLASLLIDPYVNLDFKIREKILMYCALKISRLTGFDKNKFIHCYRFCAITRNLQILGAFAYLSMVKGKKNFENYIPCALHNLKINVDVLNKETNGKLKQIKDILDGI